MKNRFAKQAATCIVALSLLAEAFVLPTSVGAAQTAPGTNITNSATATYTDASGNSYSTTSNTVTTVVQNAPTLSETAATGSAYSPGQVVSDVFTITNGGNAAGAIQVSGNNTVNVSTGAFSSVSDATFGGTDVASATIGSGPAASGCSDSGAASYSVTIGGTTTSCTSIADLNTFLNTQSIAAAASITVTVYYALSNSAATSAGSTITSTLYSNISYAAAGSAVAEISSVATATETNTVVADASINQYKAQAQCASPGPCAPTTDNVGDITYTVSGTDGGSKAAKDLTSVKSLIGSTAWGNINGGANAGGVLLSDKVPQFNSTPLTLSNVSGSSYQLSVTVNSAYGYATGAKAYIVYSTSSTAATWAVAAGAAATTGTTAFTIPTSAGTIYYVGVVIVAGTCTTSGFELCSYTTNPTTNGAANVATYPAVSYSYTVAQPTGPGSANTGSVLNVADAMWGDNQTTEHVLGPNIPATSDTTCAGTCLNQAGVGINYTSSTVVPGSSDQASIQSLATYATLNGPYDSTETGACAGVAGTTNCLGADATGSYDAVVSSTNGNDFTALGFDAAADNIVNTGTTAGTPATSTTTSAGSTLCVEHTLFNSGNKNDVYSIAIAAQPTGYALPTTSGGTLSSGWTFGIYSDAGCSSALGTSTQGATTTATAVSVNSGASQQYYVKYIAPSGLKYFTRFDSTITATSGGTGTPSNATHDELYSSFIALTKSANVTATGCPSGALPSLPASDATGGKVCPGGTIAYTIDYRNLVLGTASTNASFAKCFTSAGLLTVNDDGTAQTGTGAFATYTAGNWATYTNGIVTAPADKDSASAARAGANASVLGYWNNNPATGGSTGTFTTGATRLTDQVGNTTFQLVPQGYFTSSIVGNPSSVAEPAAKDWQGTITFTAVVK